MTQIGLNEADVASLVHTELLTLGNYTLTQPGGRPVFTKEQRDAIAHAVSIAIKANNEKIIEQLKSAGVSGL
jgi:hypothetical protein